MTAVSLAPVALVVEPCPREHAERLFEAGVVASCPDHACPLCTVDPAHHHCVMGQGNALGFVECAECLQTCPACRLRCGPCLDAWAAVAAFEAPPRDPWCLSHGLVTARTVMGCFSCASALLAARESGWPGVPNHYGGVGSAHCTVCGEGSWSGAACSGCWRCPDHPRSPVALPPHLAEHPVWRWQASGTRTPVHACEDAYWDRFTHSLRLEHAGIYMDTQTGRWSA